jgi:predicted Zn-ribbon and HTH transcriptional regulator
MSELVKNICDDCGKTFKSIKKLSKCSDCYSKELEREDLLNENECLK